jgi:transmembrane sensor
MNKEHMSELDSTASITEQASQWCVLLHGGNVTRADRKAFGEWVSRSSERIEAYIQAERLNKALESKKLRWPDTPVEVLAREAKETPSHIVPLFPSAASREPPKSDQGRLKRLLTVAIAASVLVAIGGAWAFLAGPQHYATAIGEQRSVVLNDGSVVTLNTSSAIRVELTKSERTIQLLSGEALFQVAHDKTRPFDVVAGNTTVRAVGTQFNVERRASSTTITVVEGKVSVESGSENPVGKAPDIGSSIPLSAGEEVTVSPRVKPHATAANIATATAWTQRRLIFEHRPLGEVAAEFNRYNRQEIQIESAELRSLEVTGVFAANDPNSFLDFVAKIPGARIEQQADAIKVVSSN